jgi:hypothetical protein
MQSKYCVEGQERLHICIDHNVNGSKKDEPVWLKECHFIQSREETQIDGQLFVTKTYKQTLAHNEIKKNNRFREALLLLLLFG